MAPFNLAHPACMCVFCPLCGYVDVFVFYTLCPNLSVLDHVNNITRSSAQTIHALRILRAHGMADSSLHVVYRAVVVAGLTYAASAWWGCASAADRQRIEAVLRRGLIEMYAFK